MWTQGGQFWLKFYRHFSILSTGICICRRQVLSKLFFPFQSRLFVILKTCRVLCPFLLFFISSLTYEFWEHLMFFCACAFAPKLLLPTVLFHLPCSSQNPIFLPGPSHTLPIFKAFMDSPVLANQRQMFLHLILLNSLTLSRAEWAVLQQ